MEWHHHHHHFTNCRLLQFTNSRQPSLRLQGILSKYINVHFHRHLVQRQIAFSKMLKKLFSKPGEGLVLICVGIRGVSQDRVPFTHSTNSQMIVEHLLFIRQYTLVCVGVGGSVNIPDWHCVYWGSLTINTSCITTTHGALGPGKVTAPT